jgi:hypothetical protein
MTGCELNGFKIRLIEAHNMFMKDKDSRSASVVVDDGADADI